MALLGEETEEIPSRSEEDESPSELSNFDDFSILERDDGPDMDSQAVFETESIPEESLWNRSQGSGRGDFEDSQTNLDQWVRGEKSFYEKLQEDIAVAFRTPRERFIAGQFRDLLDERGYVPAQSVAEISAQLKISQKEVQDVLYRLQKIVPAGIFARDLKESLTLQLQEKGLMSDIYAHILDHLDVLGTGNFSKVGKKIGLDLKAMEEALIAIRFLKAHPLREIEVAPVRTVVPDVLVQKQLKGFMVMLNPQVQPKVALDRKYRALIKEKGAKKELKRYVQVQSAAAHFIVRAVQQRLETIFLVAQAIVEEQQVFMEKGLEYLRPMGLKQIAERVGIHESTVSRAVSGKYMSTPVGVFEMRWFFTQKVFTIFGHEGLSQTTVRDRIRQLVSQESASSPLSDELIRKKLEEEGIQIARRTVAKYREQGKIPPASRRRRR